MWSLRRICLDPCLLQSYDPMSDPCWLMLTFLFHTVLQFPQLIVTHSFLAWMGAQCGSELPLTVYQHALKQCHILSHIDLWLYGSSSIVFCVAICSIFLFYIFVPFALKALPICCLRIRFMRSIIYARPTEYCDQGPCILNLTNAGTCSPISFWIIEFLQVRVP